MCSQISILISAEYFLCHDATCRITSLLFLPCVFLCITFMRRGLIVKPITCAERERERDEEKIERNFLVGFLLFLRGSSQSRPAQSLLIIIISTTVSIHLSLSFCYIRLELICNAKDVPSFFFFRLTHVWMYVELPATRFRTRSLWECFNWGPQQYSHTITE